MATHRKIDSDGIIVTHFSGRHTLEDALNALQEIVELNKGKKVVYEIVIVDDDIDLVFSRADEEQLALAVRNHFSMFDAAALAVVANDDLVFGMSRVLGMTSENERMVVAVFRSEDLARNWIVKIRKQEDQQP